ncbi:hypothetical protein AB0K48_56520, partial [Nonomuraea sp. NPDC055795]
LGGPVPQKPCSASDLATDTEVAAATTETTAAGQEEVARWFSTPVVPSDRPRDELVIKLAVAVAAKQGDVAEVIDTQRTATMRTLQQLTRAKRAATGGAAQRLVLESMIFQAEAEQRWLDHCEAVLEEER